MLARLQIAPGINTSTLPSIERHLKHAIKEPTTAYEATILLAQIYAATGRSGQAETYLRPLADRHPAIRLALAQMARERGDQAAVAVELDNAARVFRDRAEADSDDIEARLLWARAVSGRSDFKSAVDIIGKGLSHSDDPRYHVALARTYALWAHGRAAEGPSTAGERLALLELGLRHDPNNPMLIEGLARSIEVGGADVGRIRAAMQARLVDGKATSATHLVLGLDAFSRGDANEARVHWEQAFRIEPTAPIIANNLAWLLAHAEQPDLARALELANRAIEQRPKQPRFRGTRASILMKLKRWPEALADLELSLAADPRSVETHLNLAEVYQKVGSSELASQHRARAAVLKQAAASSRRQNGPQSIAKEALTKQAPRL